MKFSKFLILLVIVIWLSSSLTYVLYKGYYKEIKIKEFDMDITVTADKFIGLNVDKDAVHFGIVPRGGSSTRHINISNTKRYDVFIYLVKDNSLLSSIVSIEPNYFVLKSNENKEVDVRVSVPEDFEPGNYTGKITVMGKVPFFR